MAIEGLKKIPQVGRLLHLHEAELLADKYGHEIVKHFVREHLSAVRHNIENGSMPPRPEEIISSVKNKLELISAGSLKRVINATGIILNTNLGRAPLGHYIAEEIKDVLTGYSNLEFDLTTGKRSKRIYHVVDLIKYLTGAEDAVVVNNNAAAVSLIMKVFAEGREVIISRGELVEIGGSFRMPDIIKASGSTMIEVGTTNRTNLNDYKNAVTENSRLILKVHKSNYVIEGFTEEVSLSELSDIAKENKLILVYDIGSGLLNGKGFNCFNNEPTVTGSIASGHCGLITFSCDKLLGGPQAGIIAGRKSLIRQIARHPLMRTYRVDKIILAALSSVLRLHLNEGKRNKYLPVYQMLAKKEDELKAMALKLASILEESGIPSEVVSSVAYSGGGTMPGGEIKSYALKLINIEDKKDFAQKIYHGLLNVQTPVAAILKNGSVYFDMLTLSEEDIHLAAEEIKLTYEKFNHGDGGPY